MPECPTPEFQVRPPLPAEASACRRLLPRAAAEGQQRSFRLAVAPDGRLFGAASWREYPDRTADLQVRVVQPYRLRGIGRGLVTAILEGEAARGSPRAEAWVDGTAHPEAEPFLHALGFTTEDQLTSVEGDLDPMLAPMDHLVERLRAGNRIPEDVRVCRLATAPLEPVAHLYRDFLNRRPGFRADLFTARLVPEHYPFASVVLVRETVAGFLLGSREGELARVPARVVAPGFRGSWVNALLLLSSLEAGRNVGIRRVRFEYWSDNHDTLRLAHRLGARVTRTQVLLSRGLSPFTGSAHAPG